MVEKIANTMYVFAIVYLIAGLLAGLAVVIYAAHKNMEAVRAVKSLFLNCLFFAVILLAIVWLIS